MCDRCVAYCPFFTVFAHGLREKNVALGAHDNNFLFVMSASLWYYWDSVITYSFTSNNWENEQSQMKFKDVVCEPSLW